MTKHLSREIMLTLLKPAILVFCLIYEPTGVIHEHCSQRTASSSTTNRPFYTIANSTVKIKKMYDHLRPESIFCNDALLSQKCTLASFVKYWPLRTLINPAHRPHLLKPILRLPLYLLLFG